MTDLILDYELDDKPRICCTLDPKVDHFYMIDNTIYLNHIEDNLAQTIYIGSRIDQNFVKKTVCDLNNILENESYMNKSYMEIRVIYEGDSHKQLERFILSHGGNYIEWMVVRCDQGL